ncbi:MAG: hypothetical protein FJ100_06695 [Deltaproteobacteria bacterium]|nr:hypothetical protein [Deltaproteobacteria bacterium]
MNRMAAWALLGALAGCAPVYTMTPPEGFVRYEKRKGLAFITADGVQVRGRTVKNYPKADLPFWADAMERHLVARGYLLHGKTCFKTAAGRDGCTAEFVLPHGGEDWVLAETVFVHGDHLALVEATGPFDRYKKAAPAIAKALQSFEIAE